MNFKISYDDVMYLAARITDTGCAQGDIDIRELEENLQDKFGIDFDNFYDLIGELAPMCHSSTTKLTGKNFCGFVDKKHGFYMVKIEEENKK